MSAALIPERAYKNGSTVPHRGRRATTCAPWWLQMTPLPTNASDILVTTPRTAAKIAAAEAADCITGGGGFYFRTFRRRPTRLAQGSRIYYVEDGFTRGYGVVYKVFEGSMRCGTTGKDWGEGFHAVMPANSWTWIIPIPHPGFQGWRYFDGKGAVDYGGWLLPKPQTM